MTRLTLITQDRPLALPYGMGVFQFLNRAETDCMDNLCALTNPFPACADLQHLLG